MAVGTTLIEFKRAAVTALALRPGLAGVSVEYARAETTAPAEGLWFEEAEAVVEIPVMKAGTKRVEESYTTTLVVQVLLGDGRDQEAADTRAAVLLAEVQQAFAEKPDLIEAIMWAEVIGWQQRTAVLGNSGAARFEVTIRVRARLFP
ncbi:hypothetical protein NLX83_39530 [Allokutzneria sp. A3M-2-11 16]|uniref:hypothetical protein n=1 Tax=Allokutzneria sp. A3M-2-11 16 TaxID=2962043 RepID=UPI0020B837E2|nr:hypothetical protein [Allokutzneria sp. A3M-2-11 16]MCP3805376.1 hypothetical protein [Allokutzneria sp. A3M-2-11 16]